MLVMLSLRAFVDKVLYVIFPLWIMSYSHSESFVSYARIAEYLPFLILGLFIGQLVDIVGVKFSFLAGCIGQAFCIALFIEIPVKEPSYTLLMLIFLTLSFSYSISCSLLTLAKRNISRDNYTNFNKKLGIMLNLSDIIVPVLLSLLLLKLSFITIFICMSLMTLGNFILFFVIFSGYIPPNIDEVGRKKSLGVYFGFLFSCGNLAPYSFITGLANGVFSVSELASIVYLKLTMEIPNNIVSVIMGVICIGALLGSYLSPLLIKRFTTSRCMLISMTGMMLNYALLAQVDSLPLFVILKTMESLFFSIFMVAMRTYRMHVTPKDYMGGMLGLTGSIFKLFIPVFLFAWSSISLNKSQVFWVGALIMVFINLIFMVIKYDHTSERKFGQTESE